VEAGVWAPTGGNAQTWVFIIITDCNRIQKIKAVSPGILGIPSALIVVCQDKELAYKKGGELGRDILSIMDAASKLIEILEKNGIYDEFLSQVRTIIEANKYKVMTDKEEFLAFLDDLVLKMVEKLKEA